MIQVRSEQEIRMEKMKWYVNKCYYQSYYIIHKNTNLNEANSYILNELEVHDTFITRHNKINFYSQNNRGFSLCAALVGKWNTKVSYQPQGR